MSIKEASSVLSGIVNTLKAARRLEEALRTAEQAKQVVRERTDERDVLEDQIIRLHHELDLLGQEIVGDEKRKIVANDEADLAVAAGKSRMSKAQEEADEKIKELDKSVEERSMTLEEVQLTRVRVFNKEIEARNEELTSVERKLQSTKDKLALIKKGLEEEE